MERRWRWKTESMSNKWDGCYSGDVDRKQVCRDNKTLKMFCQYQRLGPIRMESDSPMHGHDSEIEGSGVTHTLSGSSQWQHIIQDQNLYHNRRNKKTNIQCFSDKTISSPTSRTCYTKSKLPKIWRRCIKSIVHNIDNRSHSTERPRNMEIL